MVRLDSRNAGHGPGCSAYLAHVPARSTDNLQLSDILVGRDFNAATIIELRSRRPNGSQVRRDGSQRVDSTN